MFSKVEKQGKQAEEKHLENKRWPALLCGSPNKNRTLPEVNLNRWVPFKDPREHSELIPRIHVKGHLGIRRGFTSCQRDFCSTSKWHARFLKRFSLLMNIPLVRSSVKEMKHVVVVVLFRKRFQRCPPDIPNVLWASHDFPAPTPPNFLLLGQADTPRPMIPMPGCEFVG